MPRRTGLPRALRPGLLGLVIAIIALGIPALGLLIYTFSQKPGLSQLAAELDRAAARVPAGEFAMGSANGPENERPQRQVYLDAYEIDRCEVTNVQYRRFVEATGSKAPPYWSGLEYPAGQERMPVVGVAWGDADAYCAWAGKRLPTEAEWEKACRGTDARMYPWGNDWNRDRANVGIPLTEARESAWDEAWVLLKVPPNPNLPHLVPAGGLPSGASMYGVLDLAGNASEWVADWYNWGGYANLPTSNPRSTGPPWNHSLRGSSWYEPYGSSNAAEETSRCAARNSSHASNDPRAGFRCARTIE